MLTLRRCGPKREPLGHLIGSIGEQACGQLTRSSQFTALWPTGGHPIRRHADWTPPWPRQAGVPGPDLDPGVLQRSRGTRFGPVCLATSESESGPGLRSCSVSGPHAGPATSPDRRRCWPGDVDRRGGASRLRHGPVAAPRRESLVPWEPSPGAVRQRRRDTIMA